MKIPAVTFRVRKNLAIKQNHKFLHQIPYSISDWYWTDRQTCSTGGTAVKPNIKRDVAIVTPLCLLIDICFYYQNEHSVLQHYQYA
jgi:hypothetical protein